MLSAELISAVIGMQLPCPCTIYLGQELSFRAPVRIGDTITATVTVRTVQAPNDTLGNRAARALLTLWRGIEAIRRW